MTRREPKLHKNGRDGYYHAVFYERGRSRKWVALGTRQKRSAERKVVELADRYLKGEFDPWRDTLPDPVTIAEAIEAFAQHRDDEGFGASSTRQRLRILQHFARTLPPEIDVGAVSAEQVRAFALQKRLSAWTRQTYYARLHAFFGFCVERGFCERNPVGELKAPPKPRQPINYVAPDDLRRLLAAIEHRALLSKREGEVRWYADVVRFAAGSGLRLGELCALKWKDVDLATGVVTVRSDAVHRTKSGEERVVQVSPQAVGVLRTWHERDRPARQDFVFHGPMSRELSYALTSRLFRKYRQMAGLPEGLTFHSLRKTYGTVLASAGVPLRTVQKMLGHADISITARIYADVVDSAAREQVLQAFEGVDL